MSDKKICHSKNMFFKKHNMSDKKICCLKNMFFVKHNMSDKKHIYVGWASNNITRVDSVKNILCLVRSYMTYYVLLSVI